MGRLIRGGIRRYMWHNLEHRFDKSFGPSSALGQLTTRPSTGAIGALWTGWSTRAIRTARRASTLAGCSPRTNFFKKTPTSAPERFKEYDDFKSVFDGWDFAYSSPDIPTRVANIEKHLL